MNNLAQDVENANLHIYAADTVVYCCAATQDKAAKHFQCAFNVLQTNSCSLKPLLNAYKIKLMLFTKSKKLFGLSD